ncbi:DNA mismatch repair endonuclease MutL [Aliikangiella marina]|uniref:DNA mismatch repair endonuclease MutL n=1 Tax=Aliikangiella marina TaxID=1712262 RepID=UPI00163D6B7B|nr:DNA mismatch repair endonuclease MutL [Aliikangiella marina]
MSDQTRISLLDNRLANQIAAGEVVERPASVVKELLENSIDAGASRIEVDVERGGARLIRITDNGRGIHKDDMGLALTRHATSKISKTEDLGCIQTLGFRGEALASISAVSRLTLTSRTRDSELAWQASAQGRDMAVDIQPAAASPGTRIEVADLFFNTPARQKFLRTEKTEFNHIEEVFKRQALANFSIAFMLKHNHKIAKRVPACAEPAQYLKRIATICGQQFVDSAIEFKCQHEVVKISGWLGKPSFHRSESDIQYVFINGRPVKDKTLNHAVRQAYEGLLPPGRMATYIIYLNVDASQVDVNVHPTKHEVRFSEQRLVHDLLAKSVSDALSEQVEFVEAIYPESSAISVQEGVDELSAVETSESSLTARRQSRHALYQTPKDGGNLETFDYIKSVINTTSHLNDRSSKVSQPSVSEPTQKMVTGGARHSDEAGATPVAKTTAVNDSDLVPLTGDYYLLRLENECFFADAIRLLRYFISNLLEGDLIAKNRALLFPQSIELSQSLLEDAQTHDLLVKLGFEVQPADAEQIQIRKIPSWLAPFGNQLIFDCLAEWLITGSQNNDALVEAIINQLTECGPLPEATLGVLSGVAGNKLHLDKLTSRGAMRAVTSQNMSTIFNMDK